MITLCPITSPPSLGFLSAKANTLPKCQNFLNYCKLLKELKGIAKILNICAEKVKDHPEYVPILCEALNICR